MLGAAEFVMMGILPQTAAAMNVSIPTAGHFIFSYAIGACVGVTMLVFGRKTSPKHLVILFMALALIGNALSAAAPNAIVLVSPIHRWSAPRGVLRHRHGNRQSARRQRP